ncbi:MULTISPECIES: gallidermin/nisin family lantibiotic [Paenibacillus]|uniref:Lantibiotic n=1 Tax=Paenibacillus azoreducens TaxID=116718 RepID=A0A919Y9H7_9BACL|nr:gallidermin/nisin family lantibiotic [Paenibacillus donghaensis]GIO46654.1 hypothetical protein J34TS1_14190 [Paenibacillus azoreducens]
MSGNANNFFDLDVQVINKSDVTPMVDSKSLCTPGCTPTATLCTSCLFNCTYKSPCK